MRRAAPFAAAGTAAAGVGVAVVLSDDGRRNRIDRQARMWRLSARRLFHWAVVKVQGRRATEEQRARLEGSSPSAAPRTWPTSSAT